MNIFSKNLWKWSTAKFLKVNNKDTVWKEVSTHLRVKVIINTEKKSREEFIEKLNKKKVSSKTDHKPSEIRESRKSLERIWSKKIWLESCYQILTSLVNDDQLMQDFIQEFEKTMKKDNQELIGKLLVYKREKIRLSGSIMSEQKITSFIKRLNIVEDQNQRLFEMVKKQTNWIITSSLIIGIFLTWKLLKIVNSVFRRTQRRKIDINTQIQENKQPLFTTWN